MVKAVAKKGVELVLCRISKLSVQTSYGSEGMAVEPQDTYVELEVPQSEVVRVEKGEGGRVVVLKLTGAARLLSIMLDQIEDTNQSRQQKRVSSSQVSRSR